MGVIVLSEVPKVARYWKNRAVPDRFADVVCITPVGELIGEPGLQEALSSAICVSAERYSMLRLVLAKTLVFQRSLRSGRLEPRSQGGDTKVPLLANEPPGEDVGP